MENLSSNTSLKLEEKQWMVEKTSWDLITSSFSSTEKTLVLYFPEDDIEKTDKRVDAIFFEDKDEENADFNEKDIFEQRLLGLAVFIRLGEINFNKKIVMKNLLKLTEEKEIIIISDKIRYNYLFIDYKN